ncbi:MAG: CPBP family intramembrane glutamic endopeptidase [Candidatus Acidiferrales bacterium]
MADAIQPAVPGDLGSLPDRKLIAPLWHTILFVLIILGISAGSYFVTRRFVAGLHAGAQSESARLLTYVATLVQEWLLFLYVYAGMRARGGTIRERIHARWASGRDVWRDIGIAAVVWAILLVLEGVSSVIFRSTGGAGAKVVQQLVPHSALELPVWALLSISAGFCEEFIFRGYLQEQLRRLTGSVGMAVAIQALVFGLGHGYQGWALMVTIFFLGLVFGITAALRKSLAPTMIAHGWTDFASGSAGYILHALHRI